MLKGRSPARLAFLKQVLADVPAEGLEPVDKWPSADSAGRAPDYYLIYFGKATPTNWVFQLPKPAANKLPKAAGDLKFKAEILDTWNMTVTSVAGVFTLKPKGNYTSADENQQSINLPGKPYQAIRIKRMMETSTKLE